LHEGNGVEGEGFGRKGEGDWGLDRKGLGLEFGFGLGRGGWANADSIVTLWGGAGGSMSEAGEFAEDLATGYVVAKDFGYGRGRGSGGPEG